MTALVVYTTVGTADDARRIAEALVERRLAACVQLIPIESVFRWDGAVRHEHEVRVVLKTTALRYDAVEDAIRDLHPYELPAIHAVAVDRIEGAYADWIEASVAGG